MRSLLLVSPSGELEVAVADELLGRGGEGEVRRVTPRGPLPPGWPPLVVKLFHSSVLESAVQDRRWEKLEAMVASQPASESLCWPLAIAFDGSVPVGFAMPAVDLGSSVPWASLAHLSERRRRASSFSLRYALRACQNLAAALDAAHRVGALIGDVNESNLFVASDASVTVIDCDSAQVADSSGSLFRCLVGKPEFSAPELIGSRFADVDRSPASDVFAFAVLVFQMLTGGCHPFDARPVSLDDDVPTVPERIVSGWSPYVFPQRALAAGLAAVPRVPFRALPRALVPFFAASFSADVSRRPPLSQWWDVLQAVEGRWRSCSRGHDFDAADGACGWCEHVASGQEDTWGQASALPQRPLPAVSFQQLSRPTPQVAATPVHKLPSAVTVTVGQQQIHLSPSQAAALSAQLGGQASVGSPVSAPSNMVSASSWPLLALKHPVVVARHVRERFPFMASFSPPSPPATRWWWAYLVCSVVFAFVFAVLIVVFGARLLVDVAASSLSPSWQSKVADVVRLLAGCGAVMAAVGYPVGAVVSASDKAARLRSFHPADWPRHLAWVLLGALLAVFGALLWLAQTLVALLAPGFRR